MIAGNIQAPPNPAAEAFDLERQRAIIEVQRNAIAADLGQIQSHLRLDLLQAQRERGERLNAKTVLIVEWHQGFCRALENTEHPQQVFDEFKGLLQEILVDSIFRSALDENCLLGNDGETYTEMGLQIFRNMAPAQFQNRSPLHPDVERPLVTSPHVEASYMVAWLRRHNIAHRNPQNDVVEEAYRQLNLVANRLSPPRVDQDEAMRQIMAHQAQRQMQRDQERNERVQARRIQLEEQRRAELIPVVRQGLAQVEQRVDQVAQRQLAQAGALNQDVAREIDVLQPVIDHLEDDLVGLAQRVEVNQGQNNRIQAGIVVLRGIHQQLSVEKTQLEKQIKENERAGLKTLGEALLVIGCCALGTIMIKCALSAAAGAASSTATKMVLKPIASGCMVGLSKPF